MEEEVDQLADYASVFPKLLVNGVTTVKVFTSRGISV